MKPVGARGALPRDDVRVVRWRAHALPPVRERRGGEAATPESRVVGGALEHCLLCSSRGSSGGGANLRLPSRLGRSRGSALCGALCGALAVKARRDAS